MRGSPAPSQLRRRRTLESLGCGATSDAAASFVRVSGGELPAPVSPLCLAAIVPAIRVHAARKLCRRLEASVRLAKLRSCIAT
jgi:hypothetical protein